MPAALFGMSRMSPWTRTTLLPETIIYCKRLTVHLNCQFLVFHFSHTYLRSIWLPPFRHLFRQQLFGTESYKSERSHVTTDHPVEQPLWQMQRCYTPGVLTYAALWAHHLMELTLFLGSFRLNIKDLYLFLYLLSVLRQRLNISFSMANASLPTSLSVIFRSSLSLTLVTTDIKDTARWKVFS